MAKYSVCGNCDTRASHLQEYLEPYNWRRFGSIPPPQVIHVSAMPHRYIFLERNGSPTKVSASVNVY